MPADEIWAGLMTLYDKGRDGKVSIGLGVAASTARFLAGR
jgi:hypothetical protein